MPERLWKQEHWRKSFIKRNILTHGDYYSPCRKCIKKVMSHSFQFKGHLQMLAKFMLVALLRQDVHMLRKYFMILNQAIQPCLTHIKQPVGYKMNEHPK